VLLHRWLLLLWRKLLLELLLVDAAVGQADRWQRCWL
jgi:hypothetical protein